MNRSDTIADLAASLAKAQAKIEGAVKDKSNPAFRSKYADLGSVWDAIRGPLTENGLSIVQFPRTLDGAVEVETMLLHSSGQYISDSFAIPVSKRDAHGYMSATTYARRGALMAVAGIAPVDDDGNLAAGKNGHADPIHEAKERVYTDDPHLLVNGPDDRRNQYEVTKAANGGKTPYMAEKERNGGKTPAQIQKEAKARADKFLSDSIAEHAKMKTEREVNDWWNAPERKEKLEYLSKHFPDLFKQLDAAAVERLEHVPRTLQAG